MHKGTILIVEDKDEFRKIYGDRFRFGGFDVLDASDGVQALEVLKSHPVDLVITDINMPNKDGYELISDIKTDEALKHIPVLVMSVFDTGEHLKKALSLGALDYLVKGMHSPNDVLSKVEKILSPKTN